MESLLCMNVGFVNTTFQAIDNSEYNTWTTEDLASGHLVLQRLMRLDDLKENEELKFTYDICKTVDELRNPFMKPDTADGLYIYHKLIIPSIHHFESEGFPEDGDYCYYNERIDGTSRYIDVHYHQTEVDTESGYIDHTYTIKINGAENTVSPNFDFLYNQTVNESLEDCFWFSAYSMSIYDLVECYVYTERSRLNDYFKNNCSSCTKGLGDIDAKADILLAAVLSIQNLIAKGDFFEAQRILNSLDTCGNLCKKFSDHLRGCGCGKA